MDSVQNTSQTLCNLPLLASFKVEEMVDFGLMAP
jgi:hypothetical protein